MQRYDFFFNNQQFIIRAPQNATPTINTIITINTINTTNSRATSPPENKKGSPKILRLPIKGWRRPTFPRTRAVSSAMPGLTSLFGMGRGVHRLHGRQGSSFRPQGRRPLAQDIQERPRKAFGLLVPLGTGIAALTPAAYRGRSLRPPSNEVSSRGGLRT